MKFQVSNQVQVVSGYGLFPENFQVASRLFRPAIAFESDNGAGSGGSTGSGGTGEVEDLTGLKSALENERKRSKELDRQFKQLQETVKDIDPNKYKELLSLQAQSEEWNQKEASLRTELETSYTQQLQAERQKVQQSDSRYQDLLKRTLAEKAFQAANGRSGGGEDGTTFFDAFYSNINAGLKLNDKGQIEVVDGTGARLFSKKDASKPMEPIEYFSSLTKHPVFGGYFAPNENARGGGMPPGSGSRHISTDDASKLSRTERLALAHQNPQ